MSEFAVISPIRETAWAASQKFEYFLTVIFVVIVMAYAASAQFSAAIPILLAFLYVCATALSFLRNSALAEQAGHLFVLRSAMESDFSQPQRDVLTPLRMLLMVVGPMVAVLLVFRPLSTRRLAAKAKSIDAEVRFEARKRRLGGADR